MPIKAGNELILFDAAELAKMFGVTPLTVKTYIRQGRLKGQKMGIKWYVSEASLAQFFNAGRGVPKKARVAKKSVTSEIKKGKK